jgi:hypothetical protein
MTTDTTKADRVIIRCLRHDSSIFLFTTEKTTMAFRIVLHTIYGGDKYKCNHIYNNICRLSPQERIFFDNCNKDNFYKLYNIAPTIIKCAKNISMVCSMLNYIKICLLNKTCLPLQYFYFDALPKINILHDINKNSINYITNPITYNDIRYIIIDVDNINCVRDCKNLHWRNINELLYRYIIAMKKERTHIYATLSIGDIQ